MPDPSPLDTLVATSKQFPSFAAGMAASTGVSLMSDPLVASLGIGSAAVAHETHSLSKGLATFWLLYATLRMIAGVAITINTSGQQVSGAIAYHANSITTPVPTPDPTPNG